MGSLSQTKEILGLSNARSCMILLARRSSRRWTTATVRAKRARKVASSRAESLPPTTAMSWSRKKNPSQVAHHETPCPDRRFSFASPELLVLRAVGDDHGVRWSPSQGVVKVVR